MSSEQRTSKEGIEYIEWKELKLELHRDLRFLWSWSPYVFIYMCVMFSEYSSCHVHIFKPYQIPDFILLTLTLSCCIYIYINIFGVLCGVHIYRVNVWSLECRVMMVDVLCLVMTLRIHIVYAYKSKCILHKSHPDAYRQTGPDTILFPRQTAISMNIYLCIFDAPCNYNSQHVCIGTVYGTMLYMTYVWHSFFHFLFTIHFLL